MQYCSLKASTTEYSYLKRQKLGPAAYRAAWCNQQLERTWKSQTDHRGTLSRHAAHTKNRTMDGPSKRYGTIRCIAVLVQAVQQPEVGYHQYELQASNTVFGAHASIPVLRESTPSSGTLHLQIRFVGHRAICFRNPPRRPLYTEYSDPTSFPRT